MNSSSKNHLSFCFYSLLLMMAIWGCSTRKDKFVNRAHHALNTKFNILYNGRLALEEGKQELIEAYQDNYWEILPVERLEISEEIRLGNGAKNAKFERAEEKAVKAVQKHSMNIQGRERNPQMDEAYLLLGMSRYYDQRFVPALEAFNYILFKYPDSDRGADARVWREKTNLRMGNEDLTIENLSRMLSFDDEFEDQTYADAHAALAQAYINLKKLDTAVLHIEEAASYTPNKEEKGRYYFILGQLYERLQKPDSAVLAFNNIIEMNRQTNRDYLINAYLEKAKNFEVEGRPRYELLEMLEDLQKNRENRPYLDKIYRQLALYYWHENETFKTTAYLESSLRTGTQDRQLRSMNYEDLAEIYFDEKSYAQAGKYYDSTLINLNERTLKYNEIRRKRDNLTDVIKYEDIAQKTDSILYVAGLSMEEQQQYFSGLIEELRQQEELRKEQEENQSRLLQQGVNISPEQGMVDASGKFYFYNTALAAVGNNRFRQIWGDIILQDNWRYSSRSSSVAVVENQTQAIDTMQIDNDSRFSLDYYLEAIPRDSIVLDSLHRERDLAYYQLGVIYKEKFKEYKLASNKLQKLLEITQDSTLILPAKYNLYRIYEQLRDVKAIPLKKEIIENYPESNFAALLQNVETRVVESSDTPAIHYANTYSLMEQQQYEKVIDSCKHYAIRFNGDDLVPKFELLKATALARLDGIDAYEQSLKELSLAHPNSEEGKEAERIVQQDLSSMKLQRYDSITRKGSSKLVYVFTRSESGLAHLEKTSKIIQQAIKDLLYDNLSLSVDVYSREKIFLVVHGLASVDRAEGFAELLRINKDYLVNQDNLSILNENYAILQIQKNIDTYLQTFRKPLE